MSSSTRTGGGSDEAPWRPGARVGEHVLLSRLGAGGMGEVWLAEQVGTGVRHALKTLRGADAELLLRFAREGEAQARVDTHRNVLRVHGSGVHGDAPYLVLELAVGGDLQARLERGPLPPCEAARLVRDLARGLAHAHARGVLHRDLKPQNVLFDGSGAPKLVDFGLARLAGAETLTRSGDVVGTPAYMAPEQVQGRADAQSDVYGLGAVLYHALTGRPPFRGPGPLQVLQQVLEAAPAPPASLVAEVPPGLDALCLACLAKDPGARPPGAAALATALDQLLQARPGPRRRARWAAGALALGALLLVGWAALDRPPESPPAAQPVPPAPPPSSARAAPAPPGRWSARIAAERATSQPALDLPQLLGFDREISAALEQDGDAALRRLAEGGHPRAQRELAERLLRAAQAPGADRDALWGEAAEWLWRAARMGSERAVAGLGHLLLQGGVLGGLEADRAAVDALLAPAERRTGEPAVDDQLAIAGLFLARGGPADLLRALSRLSDGLGRAGAGQRGALLEGNERAPHARLLRQIALEEGWAPRLPRLEPVDLTLLEAERLGPLVRRYRAAAAAVRELDRQPGVPLADLLALSGGRSVLRPGEGPGEEEALAARLELEVIEQQALPDASGWTPALLGQLRGLAARGQPEAQWLLGECLLTGRGATADPRAAEAWIARAALEPGGSVAARAWVGRELLVGGPELPGDGWLALPWLESARAALLGTRRTGLTSEVEVYLGLCQLVGEGLAPDREAGQRRLRAALGDARPPYLGRLASSPRLAGALRQSGLLE